MIVLLILTVLAAVAICIANRYDTRQPYEILTFGDWWRECRYQWHVQCHNWSTDPYRRAHHMIAGGLLLARRKALMWDVLAGTRAGD